MEKVVVLFSREGCHLCERAEDLIESHFPECLVLNVDADEEASQLYGARVPVLVIEGKAILEGNFVEAEVLRLAQEITSQDECHDHSGHE